MPSPSWIVALAAAQVLTEFPAGKAPSAVASADLDGNGFVDLIVANAQSNDLSVFLSAGRSRPATWKAPAHFPAGNSPNDLAIADFDGDGKLDAAVANHEAHVISILIGDGRGAFAAPRSISVQSKPHPHGVAAGDFNGDKKIDLAVESWEIDSVEILFGDGRGGFAVPGRLVPVGKMPYQRLRAADLDKDGNSDLVTPNLRGNNVSILLADGKGAFTAAPDSPISVPDSPFAVAIGDVDGDRKLDLAIAHYSGFLSDPTKDAISVHLGDGTGKFRAAPGSPFRSGRGPTSIALGDFDGDGALDVAASNLGSDDVSLLTGGRKQLAPAKGSPFRVGSQPAGVAFADMNGDGIAELFVANNASHNVTVAFPDKAGFWWKPLPGWRTETIPFPLDFAPSLAHSGVEELRFGPGFFDKTAPQYFTYAFVWWLDGTPNISPAALKKDLEVYFHGLCRAVANDEKLCAREGHRAELDAKPTVRDETGHRRTKYRAKMRTIDPFKAKAELDLDVELITWRCPISRRTVVLAKLAPKSKPSAELEQQAAAFRCHAD